MKSTGVGQPAPSKVSPHLNFAQNGRLFELLCLTLSGPIRGQPLEPHRRGCVLDEGKLRPFSVGDFNAKHTSFGCQCSNTRGNRLYSYIVNNSIDVFAPLTPTRFGVASASI
ncbi:hypothetical protein TNIN_83191 [Trichonephila inaurata madagascariensis]|uniref:Endonuclease/exonuclease/phosphatase domain-containing protein n=1 Tax=Trichonephila inaurata madagascariensis TaxID=2747483 RepID=A0A8X6YP44_9ARAC|nr:hypothetical protein TNIN_83191 [Trichonephila inaurata madagascariensis]